MKLRSERDHLAHALATVGRAVSTRFSNPAAQGAVRFDLTGEVLTLCATDGDMTIEAAIEVTGIEDGLAAIPVRLLNDIVRAMPEGAITLEASADTARITGARAEFEMNVYAPESFPVIPVPQDEGVTLPGVQFAQAVGQVVKCASDDEIRPVLTGVLLSAGERSLRLVATDSYRLALRDVEGLIPFEKGTNVLIPARALTEVDRLITANGKDLSVQLHMDAQHAAFHIGRAKLTTQLINDTFPDYERLIPKRYFTTFVVNREALLASLRRMRLLVMDAASAVRMSTGEGSIGLSVVSAEVGRATEELDATVEGQPTDVSFNPTYMIEGAEVSIGEDVMIEVAEEGKPSLLHGTESRDYLYLLMPVRVP